MLLFTETFNTDTFIRTQELQNVVPKGLGMLIFTETFNNETFLRTKNYEMSCLLLKHSNIHPLQATNVTLKQGNIKMLNEEFH